MHWLLDGPVFNGSVLFPACTGSILFAAACIGQQLLEKKKGLGNLLMDYRPLQRGDPQGKPLLRPLQISGKHQGGPKGCIINFG
jgi:hypothetical protein